MVKKYGNFFVPFYLWADTSKRELVYDCQHGNFHRAQSAFRSNAIYPAFSSWILSAGQSLAGMEVGAVRALSGISTRSWMRLARWTVFGTLGCIVISVGFNYIYFWNEKVRNCSSRL